MTSIERLNKLAEFKKSEVYEDFLSIGNAYYNSEFKEALNAEKDNDTRVNHLERMRGVGLMLDIFNALEAEYEKNQGDK